MTHQRFTEWGDEGLEAAISRTIDALTQAGRRIPHLEALLLGGSLGRGEGTTRRSSAGDELASDIELYLVGRSASLRHAARAFEIAMADSSPTPISAAWVHTNALRRGRAKNMSWRGSRTIRLYELSAGARALVGRLPDARPIDPAELPLAEGVRLILNRLAEATPEMAGETQDADRWLDKVLIACGDTLLLSAGVYTVLYRDRAHRLVDLEEPWTMPTAWRKTISGAYERKLTGEMGEPVHRAELASIVEATLGAAVALVPGIGLEPLGTFPARFVTAGARHHELLRYLPPVGPPASYEGLLVLGRVQRAGGSVTVRSIAQAAAGRPLSLTMQAVAAPLFFAVMQDRAPLLGSVARALRRAGLSRAEIDAAEAPAELAGLVRRYWRMSS